MRNTSKQPESGDVRVKPVTAETEPQILANYVEVRVPITFM
jgi:hypothetical protein